MAESLTPEQVLALAEEVAQILAAQSQGVGEVTKVTSLDGVYSLPALLFTGTDETVVEAPISLLRVWLQRGTGAIEWKQGDTGEWQSLISIPDLTGPKGETPEFRTGSAGIEWKYTIEDDTAWKPLVSIDQLKLTFDMLTEAQKETIRGYSAFQLWQQEEGNADKSYEDYKAWIKKDALDAAQTALNAADQTNKVKKVTEQVKKETEDVQARTDQVRINTLTTKIDTEDILKETRQIGRNTEQTRINTLATNDATGETRNETEKTQIQTDQTRIKTLTAKLDTENVLNETRQVKDCTDQIRIKTLSTENATGLIKSETEQTQIRTDQTRIETLKVKQATEEVLNDTKKLAEKTEHLYIHTKSIADETEQVKRNTEAIAAITQELNDHPMIVQGGMWFEWSLIDKEYKNTNIQAQGPVGTSFKIVGRFDTEELLIETHPDGSSIDGVFAVGTQEPFNYFAWLAVNGTWKWDDQGQLRGAEGKSSYEVWKELPENANKTLKDYFNFLSPQVEVLVNTPTEFRFKVKSSDGEMKTPNLMGRSGSKVLDIDHEPSENDTHYIYEGVEYAFSIGDEVRFFDPETEEFVFYKCYDLNAEKAVWNELGGGGVKLPTDIYLCSPLNFEDMEDKIFLNNGILE